MRSVAASGITRRIYVMPEVRFEVMIEMTIALTIETWHVEGGTELAGHAARAAGVPLRLEPPRAIVELDSDPIVQVY